MHQKEQVDMIMALLHRAKPMHMIKKMGEQEAGSVGVIRVLFHAQEPVRSKDISDQLGISSARMAVLLKKLETKGLIEKIDSADDARITLVQLSKQGVAFAKQLYDNFYRTVEDLIDEFGIDYLIRLLEDMIRMKPIMERNRQKIEEDLHD